MAIVVCILIAAGIAFLVTGAMKAQLKTVRPEDRAGCYIVDGSFELTESSDLYLYRRVTKTARPKDKK